MEYLDVILSIVAGLAAAIPLVIKLVQYVQAAVKEKNWNKLLDLVMNLMEEAEIKFADGASQLNLIFIHTGNLTVLNCQMSHLTDWHFA